MNSELLYISWNPNEIALDLGIIDLRWYGLCWMIGLVLAVVLMSRMCKEQKIDNELFNLLFMYSFFGILLGARLGHCLFYEPNYYFSTWSRFTEMWLPIRFDRSSLGWQYIGYAGLASHGGMIGITISTWLYSRNTGVPFLKVVDMLGIVGPLTGCCIRLGNLMNSEIIGRVTDVPWAFIFEQVDSEPRHPGQLYEAIAYLLIFIYLWSKYRKNKEMIGSGRFIGITLVLVFTLRFFIEFIKERQVEFENTMALDMGQLLSIPFILLGGWFILRSLTYTDSH